ncbi:MAG: glycosyltransferase family 2 protein [Methanocellales archaeon]|nr:glycosyltransferase family 2 protein [Methanocellales archaeon]
MKPISLIIPAYNEEKRIEKSLTDYQAFAGKNYSDYELLVVCDGCTDRTPEIVKEFCRQDSHIKILEFPHKLGKGGGVLEGFKVAKGDLIGFVDADGAVSPEEFDKLVKALNGADCAIASRHVATSKILAKQSLLRRTASRGFNLLVRMMFGLPFKDTQCGAKVIKKNIVDDILPKMISRGYEFDVELLWRIKKSGRIIKEVPITWHHKGESRFSLKYAPRMFFGLLKVRFS